MGHSPPQETSGTCTGTAQPMAEVLLRKIDGQTDTVCSHQLAPGTACMSSMGALPRAYPFCTLPALSYPKLSCPFPKSPVLKHFLFLTLDYSS